MDEKYWTTAEVAERFRTYPGTVRYWRHTGSGPRGVRVGRRVLYPESAVREWAEALHRTEPAA